ncbi:mitochondrial antiviral-signaling protein isoform X2 [Gracilinanus agilis]|uniref:mitochondrial antiviral-signaling protein isoform X2 n=1 Tax=Gracilinanus agilis TaxID=191870 RepID=UPI001CFDE546|nr:mitochondrial antiviral-signaling protein isoform X2 [Gracilinanus agilis]
MTLAEDRTEQYIRFHLSDFFRIDVLEILSHLPCLTVADQDEIRAFHERHGNRHSVWKLFEHLRKRSNWVTFLIAALNECELADLAHVIASVYAANQPRSRSHPVPPGVPDRNAQASPNTPPPPGPPEPPPPAQAASPLPDSLYNGYPEEARSEEAKRGPGVPVQDSQQAGFKTGGSGAAPNPAHSGDTSRNPRSSPGHSPSSAPVPAVTGKPPKARGGSGDGPPAPRGPLSPSASFVPRSTQKAGPLSAPQPPPPAPEDPEKPPGLPATRIPGPPKAPSSAPKFPSSSRPAPSSNPGPAPLGLPSVEEDMSKPGVLLSTPDPPYSGGSERLLFDSSLSGGSLHSPSSENTPEENDYFSVTNMPSLGKPGPAGSPKQPGGSENPSLRTFELQVSERPGADLHAGHPGSGPTSSAAAASASPEPKPGGSWGVWMGSAVAAALFSMALAFLYRRIQR